ncbi:hypothetical protein FD723_27475 [Nostoc sp. C052]|uniref:hypothetical protein n=1 Tax=Nostoc sp. C052 TaxID=2576902 RepID=UPI0015C32977|nr:hypothetical protein [Nostoc sp. C052]QLE43810.1 hypothetical protein FD723_27475 [Nostoc sp. C052]
MNRLSKEDLSQMNQNYFQSLDKEKLVEVDTTKYLCKSSIETYESISPFNMIFSPRQMLGS